MVLFSQIGIMDEICCQKIANRPAKNKKNVQGRPAEGKKADQTGWLFAGENKFDLLLVSVCTLVS